MTENGFPCPCCGYLALRQPPPGTFEICPVCWWEDGYAQYLHVDLEGGANNVSLRAARKNFAAFGASDEAGLKIVRRPKADEIP